jgi:hypothetical protein
VHQHNVNVKPFGVVFSDLVSLIWGIPPSACIAELAVERVYPEQWTELASGAFEYSHMLNASTGKTFYFSVGGTTIGERSVSGIGPAPTMFGTLDLSSPVTVGQPLSLQLNSSATDFASLAGNNTGWRISLVRPDNSTAELGLMADWEVWSGSVHKWQLSVPGGNFLLVSRLVDGTTRLHHSMLVSRLRLLPACVCMHASAAPSLLLAVVQSIWM